MIAAAQVYIPKGMTAEQRILDLQTRLEDAYETIRDLRRKKMGLGWIPSPQYGLSRGEIYILRRLMAADGATSQEIERLIPMSAGKETRCDKLVAVYIHNMRRKLRPHGIEIETIWGQVYRLSQENKRKLAGMDIVNGAERAP